MNVGQFSGLGEDSTVLSASRLSFRNCTICWNLARPQAAMLLKQDRQFGVILALQCRTKRLTAQLGKRFVLYVVFYGLPSGNLT